jgi:hypothetical protein
MSKEYYLIIFSPRVLLENFREKIKKRGARGMVGLQRVFKVNKIANFRSLMMITQNHSPKVNSRSVSEISELTFQLTPWMLSSMCLTETEAVQLTMMNSCLLLEVNSMTADSNSFSKLTRNWIEMEMEFWMSMILRESMMHQNIQMSSTGRNQKIRF